MSTKVRTVRLGQKRLVLRLFFSGWFLGVAAVTASSVLSRQLSYLCIWNINTKHILWMLTTPVNCLRFIHIAWQVCKWYWHRKHMAVDDDAKGLILCWCVNLINAILGHLFMYFNINKGHKAATVPHHMSSYIRQYTFICTDSLNTCPPPFVWFDVLTFPWIFLRFVTATATILSSLKIFNWNIPPEAVYVFVHPQRSTSAVCAYLLACTVSFGSWAPLGFGWKKRYSDQRGMKVAKLKTSLRLRLIYRNKHF